MPRYEVHVCDATGCGVVARTNNPEAAKRKLTAAVRKRSKSKFGREKAPNGRVYGEVREVVKGVVADRALYIAEEHYGDPDPPKKARRRAAAPPEGT